MADTMKAVRIHSYGGPEVVRYEDAPVPETGPGEVIVRVRASSVNPVDWKTASGSGMAKKIGERFPLVLGWDVSGLVEAVGEGVDAFGPGDEVFGMVRFPQPGEAYAEYVAAPADQLAAKPPSLSHSEAAALPMVGLTAWQALIEAAGVQEGQTVLVHAAAGGVGHVAVQLARWKGARVIGTTSRSADLVRSLGAEVVDYTTTPVEEAVSDADVVLDVLGDEAFERSLAALRPGGTIVSLREREAEERAAQQGRRGAYRLVRPDGAQMAELASLVEGGELCPEVDVELPLSEVRGAFERNQEGHTRGKVVLRVD